MPKFQRKPKPDPDAAERFERAMAEARDEDISHFKALCNVTERGDLFREMCDGSHVVIFAYEDRWRIRLFFADECHECPQEFTTQEDAIWEIIQLAERGGLDWRICGACVCLCSLQR